MIDDELVQSVKLFSHSKKNEADYDQLARLLNYDVERAALQMCQQVEACQLKIRIVYEGQQPEEPYSSAGVNIDAQQPFLPHIDRHLASGSSSSFRLSKSK